MSNIAYARGKAVIIGANGWGAGTYKVLLATGAYTPDALAHHFVSDVTNELSGGGYARATLANLSIVEDDVGGKADAKADNPVFAALSSTQTYRWAIVFRSTGVDATSELVTALDMGASGINLTGVTSHTLQLDGQLVNGRVFSVT